MPAPIRHWSLTLPLLALLALGPGIAAASASTGANTDASIEASATPQPRTPTKIPLPPSVWLFVSGLGSLAVLKAVRVSRRRQPHQPDDPPAG